MFHFFTLQVPLEGFGSFSTARSRRAGGARQSEKGHLQPDIVKHEVEPLLPLLLLQEAGRRSSSSPEDKLLSPPLAPSPPPPPPPKRRGRPPGSAKSETAAGAALSTTASHTLERDGAARPSLKRQRNSEKEEMGVTMFPAPISAPPPSARHNHSASSAGGRASEKLVFFGGVDHEERCICAKSDASPSATDSSAPHPLQPFLLRLLFCLS
jgi:hypothetical protein